MAEMLGFCPVISRSGPEKPLYGTKNRSQSPWNRPIWGAAREFDFRDEFAADSPLQRRVCCELDSLDLDEFRSAHGWPGSAMAIALRAALSLWPWMGHCPLGSCRARKALLSAPPVSAARPSATANRHRASAPARCGLRPKSRCG